MQWIEDFDLFLFDFDGLLVNTEMLHYQAYINMCADRGFTLDWSFSEFCTIAHVDAHNLRNQIYEKFPALYEKEPSWDVLYEEKKKCYMDLLLVSKIDMLPGVEKLLLMLEKKNIERCVVTNSTFDQIDLIKTRFSLLQTIPHWITREDYLDPKPSPECYLRAIELYGKNKKKIIGFEDSMRGYKALNDTPALAVLICEAHHPQLDVLLEGVIHYESLEAIPEDTLV